MLNTFIYFLAVVATSLILMSKGIEPTSWEYWAIFGCLLVAKLSGFFDEDKED